MVGNKCDASPNDPLSELSKSLVLNVMEEHKDEIIDAAGRYLADKLIRSKAAREKAKEVLE